MPERPVPARGGHRSAAEEEGYPWLCLAAHVRDPHHIAYKRSIDDFFMQEVARDKFVLAGEP